MCQSRDYWDMKTCACCGKKVLIVNAQDWVYKDANRSKYFCSYSCMRKYEKDYAEKHPPKRKSGGATEKVFYILCKNKGAFDVEQLCKEVGITEKNVRMIFTTLKQKGLIYYPHNIRVSNKVKMLADRYE